MSREFEVVSNPQFRNLHVFLVHMLSRTPHIHRELELGFILRGDATLRIGAEEYRLSVGQGYLVNPLAVHEFQSGTRDAIILAVQISPRLLRDFFAELPSLRFKDSVVLDRSLADDSTYEELRTLCLRLAKCYLEKPKGYEYECFHLTGDVLALLNRHLPKEELEESEWRPFRQRMERMLHITDHIDDNFHHKLLLEDIARQEQLTMPYLSHLFKDTLGMSFQDYLKKKRFEFARSLILDTDRTLLDISIESGFSDTRYMIRMFVSEFGCTPKAYRKNSRSGGHAENDSHGNSQDILTREESLKLLDKIMNA